MGKLRYNEGVTDSYGRACYSPDYVRRHFVRPGFECLAVVEGIIDHLQDLVVLRRPEQSTAE